MVAQAERREYAMDILQEMGYEANEWQVQYMTEWMRWEGTGAYHNPLATTYPAGKIKDASADGVVKLDIARPWWNDNGGNPVKCYATKRSGIEATVRTLTLDYYKQIRQDLSICRIENPRLSASQVRTWGTMGLREARGKGLVAWRQADEGR